MKYIVIQGRMPQNGGTAKTARILFPDWLSPTLVCAGIIGRVQELTDGNILEGGKVEEHIERYAEIIGKGVLADDIGEWVRYEDHVLLMAALRDALQAAEAERDALHLSALENVDTRTPVIQSAATADDAYREGMQAQRNSILGDMSRAGMPPDTRPLDWINGLVVKLQAAEDNLDAWRDAAGRNPLIVQHTDSDTGRITALGVAKDTMTLELQLDTTQAVAQLEVLQHDPLRLQEFGTLEEAQAAHDALADKVDELYGLLEQRTNQRDALYVTALNNLNTLRDK